MRFLFFVFLLGFSSCSLYPSEFSQRLESVQDSTPVTEHFSAVSLKAIPLQVESNATHIIVNEAGETIWRVRSTTLSLMQYVGKKLDIDAVKETESSGEEILNIESVKVLEDAQKESLSLSSYKIFKEKNARFHFEYPSSWQVHDLGRVLSLTAGDGAELVKVSRLENTQNIPLKDFVSDVSATEQDLNGTLIYQVIKNTESDIYFSQEREVVKVHYNGPNALDDPDFIHLIQSFTLAESYKKTKLCGGENKTLCPQGYRCEMGQNGVGTCIDITSTPVGTDLPQEASESTLPSVLTQQAESNTSLSAKPIENGLTYTSIPMKFSIVYPKSWWYKSLGPQDDSLWEIAFSKNDFEKKEEASIMLSVKNGARGVVIEENSQGGVTIQYPRDSVSHFEVVSDASSQEIAKSLAASIHTTQE